MDTNINQQFKEDEITLIKRWDNQRGEYVTSPFPKIGGRLRLAHEDNETLSIETEIIRYDEKTAVVLATSTTTKGVFMGFGMASIERDERLASAILELAETRAIARSLRFAGYGIENCSAEEMSHIVNVDNPDNKKGNGGNGNGYHQPNNGNGNGNNGNGYHASSNSDTTNGRLSSKQYKYIQKLNEDLGRTTADLDKQCLSMFGTVTQHLSRQDASRVIQHLSTAH